MPVDTAENTDELATIDYVDATTGGISGVVGGVDVTAEPYNAVGDGIADDHAAIQQAIEDASSDGTWRGWRVVLPPGDFRISQPLVINRRGTHLLGSGRSRNVTGNTTIIVDGGQKGIIVKHPTGIGGSLGQFTNDPSDVSRGDHSILENFALNTADNTVGSALLIHGIDVKVVCTIKHVSVGGTTLTGFNGNGINMNAGVASGNASQCVFMDVRCEGNLKHGLETAGGDSSACCFINVACDLNGQWGFHESSFLGNTFVSCHTRDNGAEDGVSGGYWCDSGSAWVGCYTEGGQPSGNMIDDGVILEPTGVETTTGTAPILTHVGSDLSNERGGFRCYTAAGADTIEVGHDNDTEKFYIGHADGTGKALRLIWEDTNKEWAWPIGTAGAVGSNGAMALTGADAPRGAGYVRAANGFTIGTASGAQSVTRAGSAPASGTWKRGDIVFHTSPSAAGNVGWICTAAGTPGTWKEWGTIAA